MSSTKLIVYRTLGLAPSTWNQVGEYMDFIKAQGQVISVETAMEDLIRQGLGRVYEVHAGVKDPKVKPK